MSVARFIADQGTMHRVPHVVTCAILGRERVVVVQVDAPGTDTDTGAPSELDTAVKAAFEGRSPPMVHRASMPICRGRLDGE